MLFENNRLTPLDIYTMDHPKFIVSCQKEESISTKRAVILLPAHPASFAHKFLFQQVQASPGMQ